MKHYALALLLTLSLTGCGKDLYEVYTNPKTAEVATFMADEGAESTPVVWNGRVVVVTFHRPASGYYVTIADLETKTVLATIDTPDFTIGCAYVEAGIFYVYGVSGVTETGGGRFNNNTISVITSTDLVAWTAPYILYRAADGTEAWNVSVTKTDDGYMMAYDYSEAVTETSPSQVRFLHSYNLMDWTDQTGRIVGYNRYLAAVTLRYSDGYYYAMFVQSYNSRQGYYLPSVIMRSTDLVTWESGVYAVMSPIGHQDYYATASDADMVETDGKTVITYLTGDQGGPAGTKVRVAEYPGNLDAFLSSHFF